MTTSESIKELVTALAKAQAIMSGAKKDTDNTFFKSRYADLASCWDAARACLPANGLSVVQTTRPSDKDEVIVITRLFHDSGEWIEGELTLPVVKADAQGFGSALTYARRYGLCAIVGIAPEDDDANAAAKAKPDARPNTATQVAVDALAGLPPARQVELRDQAKSIIHIHSIKGDVLGYVDSQDYDTEAELAVWSLLPANVRAAIKEAKRIRGVKGDPMAAQA